MHRLLTALGRGFKDKIGWKRLGIAASLLIIILAVTHLFRTLTGVDSAIVLTALTEIAPHRIALAALCVVGAFCTLTFYDFFALRTIGKTHVPYRSPRCRVSPATPSATTSAHRLYRRRDPVPDLFRFRPDRDRCRQNLLSLGPHLLARQPVRARLGMAWHPEAASAMDLLPPAMNRLIAFGCLAGIAAYFVWLLMGECRRELGRTAGRSCCPRPG